jgi:hypothetical protein
MTDAIEDAIGRILAKLAAVRRRGYASFGSEKHRFKLNPPLAEATIAAFEKQHTVQLPNDYRLFLAAAGNGGAGPYYGILPLEQWNRITPENDPYALAKPSPLRPDLAAGSSLSQALGCAPEELFQGALALNEQGDSYYGLLIVTGRYRGHVVYVDADAACPIHFAAQDFLSWYERWLDELLADRDTKGFGFR